MNFFINILYFDNSRNCRLFKSRHWQKLGIYSMNCAFAIHYLNFTAQGFTLTIKPAYKLYWFSLFERKKHQCNVLKGRQKEPYTSRKQETSKPVFLRIKKPLRLLKNKNIQQSYSLVSLSLAVAFYLGSDCFYLFILQVRLYINVMIKNCMFL